ncbi:MAG: molybdenum cofactor biosynthesis protein MoaE [Gammaproteobacteria bacterium]|nr:molybdenum cofactor biosynthesis protein MoaE [Gammaproteobacteria bacterium]
MLIEIRSTPFDPWAELNAYQNNPGLKPGNYGACATFVGTMRDYNLGDDVAQMQLQHYEGMTQHQLSSFADQVIDRHQLLDLLILHRVGDLYPNDPIVLVAAWSAHRAAAFDGCRQMMEHLKSHATFWKKETLVESGGPANHRWVGNV